MKLQDTTPHWLLRHNDHKLQDIMLDGKILWVCIDCEKTSWKRE